MSCLGKRRHCKRQPAGNPLPMANDIQIVTAQVVAGDAINIEQVAGQFMEEEGLAVFVNPFVSSVLAKAKVIQTVSPTLLNRAQQIESSGGISGLDALHLACAEKLKCSYFITCDDRIVRRYAGGVKAINPVQFTVDQLKEKDHA